MHAVERSFAALVVVHTLQPIVGALRTERRRQKQRAGGIDINRVDTALLGRHGHLAVQRRSFGVVDNTLKTSTVDVSVQKASLRVTIAHPGRRKNGQVSERYVRGISV